MTDQENAAIAEVLKAEEERLRAAEARDWTTLSDLLSDDLTFTHITGLTEDKATHLESTKLRPRTRRRENLNVRIYGDVAVMTGDLFVINPATGADATPTVVLFLIQVWVKNDGRWRLVAYQATNSLLKP